MEGDVWLFLFSLLVSGLLGNGCYAVFINVKFLFPPQFWGHSCATEPGRQEGICSISLFCQVCPRCILGMDTGQSGQHQALRIQCLAEVSLDTWTELGLNYLL